MGRPRKCMVGDDSLSLSRAERNATPPTLAVGYIRVSTKQQAGEDRLGEDVQRQAILEYAEAHNYEIVHFFVDEASGVSEHRKDLDELLFGNGLDEANIKAVITYKSDRIARDIKLYFYYLFVLEKRGIDLISVKEHFEDDEFGLASVFRSLMLFVAEQERKNITMRTSSGRKMKALKGGYAGGKAPYGYGVFNKQLMVNEKEADVVRLIFYYRRIGCTISEIANLLHDKGIKTKKGTWFIPAQVSKILQNKEFYLGYYKYGDMLHWVKGQHQPILTKTVAMIPEVEVLSLKIKEQDAEDKEIESTVSELNNMDELISDEPATGKSSIVSMGQRDAVEPERDIVGHGGPADSHTRIEQTRPTVSIDFDFDDDATEPQEPKPEAVNPVRPVQPARPVFVGGVFQG